MLMNSYRQITMKRLCCLLILGLACSTLHAEPAKGGGDAAIQQTLRKAQGMLRQLAQEKADLEAKATGLQEQVKTLESRVKELEPLPAELQRLKAGLEQSQGQNQALQTRLGEEGEKLRGLGERQRKTLGEMGKVKSDNALLVGAVQERTRWIEECSVKNRSLYETNREMLDQLGQRGFWDSFRKSEPLIGIGAIARETAAQEFQFKLEDLQVTPWKEPEPPAQPQDAGNQGKGEDEGDEDEAGATP